jgi:hypothetical protein
MQILGPEQARKDAHSALARSSLDSAKLALGGWSAVATVMAAFAAIAGTNGWVKEPAFVAMLVAVLLLYPVLFLILELHRNATCRTALQEILRSELVYEDLLRDARAERDVAKRELDATLSEYEVRMNLLKAHYIQQLSAHTQAKSNLDE